MHEALFLRVTCCRRTPCLRVFFLFRRFFTDIPVAFPGNCSEDGGFLAPIPPWSHGRILVGFRYHVNRGVSWQPMGFYGRAHQLVCYKSDYADHIVFHCYKERPPSRNPFSTFTGLHQHTNRSSSLTGLCSELILSQPFKGKMCASEVVRIVSMIICHLNKLWKAKFFILCDVIFLAYICLLRRNVLVRYSENW